MSLGWYNGYSPAQRRAAQRYINERFESGEWLRPDMCEACGRQDQPVDVHCEDYSAIYGAESPRAAGAAELCRGCHSSLHRRRARELRTGVEPE